MDPARAETATLPEKAPRGNLIPVPSEKAPPEPPLNPEERVRERALQQLDRFMSFEPKVLRGDDSEAIHDMRVSSRRLQQTLDLLYPKPRPKEVRRLRSRIRRCRGALGRVRDCDVLIRRVERSLARKRAARREALVAARQYLVDRRTQAFEKALRKLSKLNLAVLYVHLKECLASNGLASSPPQSQAPVPESSAPVSFQQRMRQSLERVWNGFESQVALTHHDRHAGVTHGARIATKRLRYLVEVIHEFKVAGSAEALAWLRQLQQVLGEWHDLEVLEEMMIEMVARPEFLRDELDLALRVQKLIQANRTTTQEHEQKYFQMTENSAEFRRVKEWADYLLASPSAFARA